MTAPALDLSDAPATRRAPGRLAKGWAWVRRYPQIAFGGGLLTALILVSFLAPLLGTVDPRALNPTQRLKDPSLEYWFGTDMLGRDLYSRVLYGGQVSLFVGFVVTILSAVFGTLLGLVSASVRWLDGIIMRIMDGLMSVPAILLAIALMAVSGASLVTVVIAITIIEIPRVARLMRSSVLTLREMPYVEAAIAAGASTPRIIFKHLLPGTLGQLTVQATYVWAVAMVIESSLSFIGAGMPPTTPSWGNIMSDGKALWQVKPYLVFIPAIFLSLTVLAINVLGDGLRDALDPRLSKRS